MTYTQLKEKCLAKMAKDVYGLSQMTDPTNPAKVYLGSNDTISRKDLCIGQGEELLLEHKNTEEHILVTTKRMILYNTRGGKESVNFDGLIGITDDTLECDWEVENDSILPFSVEFTHSVRTLQCRANAFFVMIITINVVSDFYPL